MTLLIVTSPERLTLTVHKGVRAEFDTGRQFSHSSAAQVPLSLGCRRCVKPPSLLSSQWNFSKVKDTSCTES